MSQVNVEKMDCPSCQNAMRNRGDGLWQCLNSACKVDGVDFAHSEKLEALRQAMHELHPDEMSITVRREPLFLTIIFILAVIAFLIWI